MSLLILRMSADESQIFALHQLEILDISQNDLIELPQEISDLKFLRVLYVNDNNLTDLPLGLGSISTLRMLKVTGNPWKSDIKDVLHLADSSFSPAHNEGQNGRDRYITTILIDYLRKKQASMDEYR